MSSRKVKVIALAIGQGLSTTISVISSMIFARFLTTTQLATYRQVMLAYNFAVPFLTLGIPNSIFYFFSGARERRRGIILDNICLLAIMGGFFSIFLCCGGARLLAMRFSNPLLEVPLTWYTFYPIISFPLLSLSGVLVISERVNLSVILNLLLSGTMTICLILACYFTRSYELPLIVRIVYTCISLPVMLISVFTVVKGPWDWPRWANMLAVLKFSIPLGVATMLSEATHQIGNLIVSCMCSPEEYAVYSNGAIELPMIGMLTGAISTIVFADMSKYCKEGCMSEAIRLFKRAAGQSAFLLLPCMFFFLFFHKDFILLMYSSKYAASQIPFFIYLFILPARIVYYGPAFIAAGHPKVLLARSLGDFIAMILLSSVLVHWVGAYGAAIGAVSFNYIWSIPFSFYQLTRIYHCRISDIIPFKEVFNITIISFVVAIIAWGSTYFLHNSQLFHFLAGGGVFTILFFGTGLRFSSEGQACLETLSHKLHFLSPFSNWIKHSRQHEEIQ